MGQPNTIGNVGSKLVGVLMRRRIYLRGSYLEYLVVFFAFTLVAIIYTDFVAFHITHQLFAGVGDATDGFLWLNFADPGINPVLSHSSMGNYPYGEDFGGPTFITYSALWLPLRVLSYMFGPIAGLNLVMFCGYIGTALLMYWLIKRLTGHIGVALFSGFAVTFTPYALYNSSSHLSYIFSGVFILILASFIALWLKPSWKRAILFASAIALAFYTDGYYLLIASVFVLSLVLAGLGYMLVRKMALYEYWDRLKVLLLSLGVLLMLIAPIGYVQATQGSKVAENLANNRSNITQEIHEYRSRLIDFFLPAGDNPFLASNATLANMHAVRNQHSNPVESTTYLGYTLIMLIIGGVALFFYTDMVRKKETSHFYSESFRRLFIFVICIGVIAGAILVLSMLSPEKKIFGHTIPSIGALLSHFHIGLWRVMSRFYIPLHVILVLFASLALWVILARLRLIDSGARRHYVRGLVCIVLLTGVLGCEYATAVYRPPFDFKNVPEGYYWLRDQRDIKTVAELPLVDPLDNKVGDYFTAQIVHGKNLIDLKNPGPERLTNALGGIDNPETIDFVYQRGAQAIITHDEPCGTYGWGVLAHESGSINTKDKMCIYRLVAPPTNDDVFVRYGSGFIPSPNAKDQSVAVLSGSSGELLISDPSLEHPFKGVVSLSATLSLNDVLSAYGSQWAIYQNSGIVAQGAITGTSTYIEAPRIQNSGPLNLEIIHPGGSSIDVGGATLRHVIAKRD